MRREAPRMSKVWFVTGASSGIGAAVVQAALAHGDTVAATFRDEAAASAFDGSSADAIGLVADVRVRAQVDDAVARAVGSRGRLDVVVNSAGYGLVGAVEELSDDELHDQVDVNLFGTQRVDPGRPPHLPCATHGRGRERQLGRGSGRLPGHGCLRREQGRGRAPVGGVGARGRAAGHRRRRGRTGQHPHRLGRTLDAPRRARHRRLRRDRGRVTRVLRRPRRPPDRRSGGGRTRDRRRGRGRAGPGRGAPPRRRQRLPRVDRRPRARRDRAARRRGCRRRTTTANSGAWRAGAGPRGRATPA